MRELAKSVLSLSWAMSLFGLKQAAGLFAPGSSTATSFEAVTRCTEDQLGPVTQSTFRAGDNLQRGLVDLTFALFTFGLWQPNRGRGDSGRGVLGLGGRGGAAGQPGGWSSQGTAWPVSPGASAASAASSVAAAGAGAVQSAGDLTAQAIETGIDLVQQGVNAAYQVGGGGSTQRPGNTGWGPVPPPGGDFQTSGSTVAAAGVGARQSAGDFTAPAIGTGIDLVQQGIDAGYQVGGSGSTQQPEDTGWGPVPPTGGDFQVPGGGSK